jgi:hypothetical protein
MSPSVHHPISDIQGRKFKLKGIKEMEFYSEKKTEYIFHSSTKERVTNISTIELLTLTNYMMYLCFRQMKLIPEKVYAKSYLFSKSRIH